MKNTQNIKLTTVKGEHTKSKKYYFPDELNMCKECKEHLLVSATGCLRQELTFKSKGMKDFSVTSYGFCLL